MSFGGREALTKRPPRTEAQAPELDERDRSASRFDGMLAVQSSAGNAAVASRLAPSGQSKKERPVFGPAPDPAKTDPFYIDENQAKADLLKAFARLSEIPTLNKPEFTSLLKGYIQSAIAAQTTRDGAEAIGRLKKMLEFMDSKRMFELSHQKYRRMVAEAGGRAPDKSDVRTAAKSAEQHGELWSKLNKIYSIEKVRQRGGDALSLEASVGGRFFDGLTFGFGRVNEIASKQWKLVSQTYVRHLRGEVHAAVFRGIHPKSVFTETEWPEIKEFLKDGTVTKLVVHVFDTGKNYQTPPKDMGQDYVPPFEPQPAKAQPGNPDTNVNIFEKGQVDVFDEAQFKALLREGTTLRGIDPNDEEWGRAQSEVHKKEEAFGAAKAKVPEELAARGNKSPAGREADAETGSAYSKRKIRRMEAGFASDRKEREANWKQELAQIEEQFRTIKAVFVPEKDEQ